MALGLTVFENNFITFLVYELCKAGLPFKYSWMKLAIANWWLGNAHMRIPEDNPKLIAALETAIASWQKSKTADSKFPGFVIMAFKKQASLATETAIAKPAHAEVESAKQAIHRWTS